MDFSFAVVIDEHFCEILFLAQCLENFAVNGLIWRMERELGQMATVVVTDGLAPVILPHCEQKILHDNDLVRKGLTLLYVLNK